jgi:uncharacterized low-complexity protein
MKKFISNKTALLAAAALASAVVVPAVHAASNPFTNTELASGFNLGHDKDASGGGEGKCGTDPKTCPEGKCGEGKCGEKCRGDAENNDVLSSNEKVKGHEGTKHDAEGKCGEGKCGDDMVEGEEAQDAAGKAEGAEAKPDESKEEGSDKKEGGDKKESGAAK